MHAHTYKIKVKDKINTNILTKLYTQERKDIVEHTTVKTLNFAERNFHPIMTVKFYTTQNIARFILIYMMPHKFFIKFWIYETLH